MQNKTIITAFFDIGRDKWPYSARPLDTYLANAQKNLSIDEQMVIFIEPNLVDFVKKCRAKFVQKTHIIIIKKEELFKYRLKNQIEQIINSPEFKKELSYPENPVRWCTDYLIVIWSKTDLVRNVIELNPFHSTHFGWLDFGLPNWYKIEEFPKKFNDKIRILNLYGPEESDLDRVKTCKLGTGRFAAGFYTGEKNIMLKFIKEVDKEIKEWLNLNIVQGEQIIYSNVYLLNKDIFELYHGDYQDIINLYKY